ncbi:hypothetical protein [Ornithinimicrobium sp. W1665]|uniref:hypothetical protein n=1 Tax=Ornithinimicrobium sp. W1665 TaxID=3416666 RepID=UPI003CF4E20D
MPTPFRAACPSCRSDERHTLTRLADHWSEQGWTTTDPGRRRAAAGGRMTPRSTISTQVHR